MQKNRQTKMNGQEKKKKKKKSSNVLVDTD